MLNNRSQRIFGRAISANSDVFVGSLELDVQDCKAGDTLKVVYQNLSNELLTDNAVIRQTSNQSYRIKKSFLITRRYTIIQIRLTVRPKFNSPYLTGSLLPSMSIMYLGNLSIVCWIRIKMEDAYPHCNAKNMVGNDLPTGLYLISMRANQFSSTQKILLGLAQLRHLNLFLA